MHEAALAYVAAHIGTPETVLEFGSRNINGSCRTLAPEAHYVGVDIADGPGVDIVGDAALVEVDEQFDVVICTEVFEHTDDAHCLAICRNAWLHLNRGGKFVCTMAGIGRFEHSAVDGGTLRPDEFYRNVSSDLLVYWMSVAGFVDIVVNVAGADLRGTGIKP